MHNIVLGAGVAGVSTAWYLAKAGHQVTVIDRAEAAAITDVVRRLAMANPQVHFILQGSDRSTLNWPATGDGGLAARLAQVVGDDFAGNAAPLAFARHGMVIAGLAGLPRLWPKRRQVQAQVVDADNWRRFMSPQVPPWQVPHRYAHLLPASVPAKEPAAP